MLKNPLTERNDKMTEKKKHGYCGKCIFCLSVCPECKSTDVVVAGVIEFDYYNNSENYIQINLSVEYLSLFNCESCGANIYPDEFRKDLAKIKGFNDDKTLSAVNLAKKYPEKLEKLKKFIQDILPDHLDAEWKDGKVNIQQGCWSS